jgi:hypothetical protein
VNPNILNEIDADGVPIKTFLVDLHPVRSVAYDAHGGVIIAGTRSVDDNGLGRWDGTTFSVLSVVGGEMLSLVRPSPQSGDVLVLGRTRAATLWQIPRPQHVTDQ